MRRKRLLLPLLLASGGLLAFVVGGCGGETAADAVCGNGVVESGEFCDDGTQPGDAPTAGCTELCRWREFSTDQNSVTGSSREAAVAMNERGDFVVVWQAWGGELGGAALDVFAAVYGSNGELRTPAMLVNQQTDDDQMYPAVGIDGQGRFVVVWHTENLAGPLEKISMRAFAPDGTPATDELQVNTWTDGAHKRAYIGVNQGGDMVISWGNDGQDGDLTGVFATLGDSSGNLSATAPFQVNTIATAEQGNPHVGISDAGDFVIAWESQGQETG